MDPVTAARRWQRLQSSGQAWVAAHPGNTAAGSLAGAIVEVTCEPSTPRRVADLLAEDPRVLNVLQTTGARDILLTVATGGMSELTRYLATAFNEIPGILNIRSSIITRIMREGSQWHGGALTAAQQAALRPPAHPEIEQTLESIDYRLLTVLAEDGRASLGELAGRCGTSVSTVRRRLPQLLSSGAIRLRPDIARGLTEYPYVAEYFVQAPAASLSEIHEHLSTLPSVRSCLAVMGPCNLIVGAWLKTEREIRTFEDVLTSQNLPIKVVDRSPILRFVKHVGRILDDDGNAIRYVPVEYRLTDQTRLASD